MVYAAYLHARSTAGWKGRNAAIVALVGLATLWFNFIGINFFFDEPALLQQLLRQRCRPPIVGRGAPSGSRPPGVSWRRPVEVAEEFGIVLTRGRWGWSGAAAAACAAAYAGRGGRGSWISRVTT